MRPSTRFPTFFVLLVLSAIACTPDPDPGGDGGPDAADAGGNGVDGGGFVPPCAFTLNGLPGSDPGDCDASAAADVGDASRTVVIGYVGQPGDPDYLAFSVTVEGALQATTYTMAGAVRAAGSLTHGDEPVAWRILKEPGTTDGDFTLTISDTGTALGTGESATWTGVHGTFAASLSPVLGTGATGTAAFTLEF